MDNNSPLKLDNKFFEDMSRTTLQYYLNTLPPTPVSTSDGGKCCPNPEQLLAKTGHDETLLTVGSPHFYHYDEWDTKSVWPDTCSVSSIETDTEHSAEPTDSDGGGVSTGGGSHLPFLRRDRHLDLRGHL